MKARITSIVNLTQDVVSIWVKEKNAAIEAVPGQFVTLYCKDGSRLLPRPISICEIDKENGLLRLVYRIVGEGTSEFSGYRNGDSIEMMGPLGNGFPLNMGKALLIGGGIGIPPLLELAKQLVCEKNIVLGYRDLLFLVNDFNEKGQVHIATEDGSFGIKGNVLDAIRARNIDAEVIYACGPLPMLKGVQIYAKEKGLPAWLSLEEHMACGIGACLACMCESAGIDHHTKVKNKRICKDGPVFLGAEVILQ